MVATPRLSQRRAPFTSRPMPGISTSTSSTTQAAKNQGAAFLPAAQRHQEHRGRGRQREREEQAVPQQEVGRIVAGVAARLGGRDRGRVHHHQAERDQQQRGPGERAVVLGRRRAGGARVALAEETDQARHQSRQAPSPPRRRPRRGACSRGTCRSSRRPATAAPRRPAAAICAARATAFSMDAQRVPRARRWRRSLSRSARHRGR